MATQDPHSATDQQSYQPLGAEAKWFYTQRGETYGPVRSADLSAAAHLGFLGPDDMVRRADSGTWVAARLIQGLFKNPT
jgi:hypothetical protein